MNLPSPMDEVGRNCESKNVSLGLALGIRRLRVAESHVKAGLRVPLHHEFGSAPCMSTCENSRLVPQGSGHIMHVGIGHVVPITNSCASPAARLVSGLVKGLVAWNFRSGSTQAGGPGSHLAFQRLPRSGACRRCRRRCRCQFLSRRCCRCRSPPIQRRPPAQYFVTALEGAGRPAVRGKEEAPPPPPALDPPAGRCCCQGRCRRWQGRGH